MAFWIWEVSVTRGLPWPPFESLVVIWVSNSVPIAVTWVCSWASVRRFNSPSTALFDKSRTLYLIDKAKETVGLGQTPSKQAAMSDRPVDIEKAFDALGVSVEQLFWIER